MGVKKAFKRILLLCFLAFMVVGIYAAVKKTAGSKVFIIRSVEIRGVMNADREKLSILGKKLIGLNVFSEDLNGLLRTDDPWVQKISAVRALPDGVNILVYEEKPLFSFKDDKGVCHVFTGGAKRIKTSCKAVTITAEKELSDEKAAMFALILENNDYLKTAAIVLKDYSFVADIGGDKVYCPYDGKIFDENYKIYKESIRKRYKYVEYADLTISGRVFVKGARNESSKG